MKKSLKKANRDIWHIVDGTEVHGRHARIRGDATNISGDVTNISGSASGIWGDATNISGSASGIRGDATNISGSASQNQVTSPANGEQQEIGNEQTGKN